MNSIMEQVKIRRAVKIMRARGFLRCAGIAALFATSGCALLNPEGTEAYASLGVRAVHKHKVESETIEAPCRGWKAVIMGCGTTVTREPKEEGKES